MNVYIGSGTLYRVKKFKAHRSQGRIWIWEGEMAMGGVIYKCLGYDSDPSDLNSPINFGATSDDDKHVFLGLGHLDGIRGWDGFEGFLGVSANVHVFAPKGDDFDRVNSMKIFAEWRRETKDARRDTIDFALYV